MKAFSLLIPRRKLILTASMLLPLLTFAAGKPKPSSLENPLAMTLLIIIAVLALVIGLLAYVVVGAAGFFTKKQSSTSESKLPRVLPVIALVLLAQALVTA